MALANRRPLRPRAFLGLRSSFEKRTLMLKVRNSIGVGFAMAALAALVLVSASGPAGASCLPASIEAKLSEIRQLFGPVRIVSAHRPGARVRGTGRRSYHASCRAVDFHPPRGNYQEVAAWLRKNHNGGFGTYSCGMHHMHIDNGARVRFHKCEGGGRYAAKGKSRKYAAKASGRKSARYASGRTSKRYASSGKSRRYASGRSSRRYASGRSSRRYAASREPRGYASPGGKARYAARHSRRNYY